MPKNIAPVADPVHVVGATGRSGRAICIALRTAGEIFIPVVRDLEKYRAGGLPGEPRVADLGDSFALYRALRDATRVISCAHARHTAAILASARQASRFVLLGSTRRYTKWIDDHGAGVLSGEAAFLESGRNGVMLHPTMIYGAAGEDNVRRLAALLRRIPVLPLPNRGRALVQPIYQDDVTRSVVAALGIAWSGPHTLVIAGPSALPYADFVVAVAHASGVRAPRILGAPATLLMVGAALTTVVPFLPRIRADEVRRLMEDKAFPVGPMFSELGIRPIPLAEGLAKTFKHTGET